jgi:predicted Fe-Mo cluster-binding NifX family protein
MDSKLDPRFGRCRYFIFVNTDDMEYEAIKNPNVDATGGAGIQSGQMMADRQVRAVVTGNIGPNAFQTLESAGIEVITGASGIVKEAVERYKNGELTVSKGATTGVHGMMG